MPDGKTYRLEDLEVKEVSVVDRGANKRTLLVVKNAEDSDMPQDAFEQAVADAQSGADVPVDDLTATDDAEKAQGKKPPFLQGKEDDDKEKQKADETEADPVVEAQADKASEDTDLIVGMDDATKAAYSETLKVMSQRLGALGEAVAAAKSDPSASTSDKLTNEIIEVSQALGRLSATDKADVITALSKGLLAETVGTQQLSLASMPMEMTAEGPMFKMPMEMAKPMMMEYARKMLYQAEDALYGPDYKVGVCMACLMAAYKAIGPFIPQGGGMPGQMEMSEDALKQYAFNQPQGSIPAGVPDSHPPSQMEKAGRKISGERLGKLESLLNQLGSLVGELSPTEQAAVTKAAAEADSTEAAYVAQINKLTEIAKAQHAELQQLRSARPSGHAEAQGEGGEEPSSGRVVWPDDLNAPEDPDLRF